MKLPCPLQVDDSRKRDHASHYPLIRSQTQRQLSACRMASHKNVFRAQPMTGCKLRDVSPSAPNILQRAWPPAPLITHSAVFDVPRRESPPGQCRTEVSGMPKVVSITPEAAVDVHDNYVAKLSRAESQVPEVACPGAITDAQIRCRWDYVQQVFGHGAAL